MKSAELARLDATAQAELVAKGEVSASELLDAAEQRVQRLEPLLHTMAAVDFARARAARPAKGPFHGVPFLLKDTTPYPGLRWAFGTRLMRNNMASPPTPFASRVDAAGFVVIGKSTMSELGLLGSTETLAEGITHNPWDLSRSATGSSGGSAAAVAAGLVPIAHANDGGGSIRIPASANGVFGFKPSRGRTVTAIVGRSDFGDITSDGCVSRSVRDTARFLSLVEDDVSGYRMGFVAGPEKKRLRIGTWTQTFDGREPDAEVLRAHAEAVELVKELGHHVEEATPPRFETEVLGDAFFLVAGAAVAGLVQMVGGMRGKIVRDDELEPFSWALARRAMERGPSALEAAREEFARAARAHLDATASYDVVLTPVLATKTWHIGHLSPLVPVDELIRRTAETVAYTPIHNIAGAPAMSVPLHTTSDGLPLGAHFAAKPGDDAMLLALAYELESARPWADRWPGISAPMLMA
ncbi:MAG TPA: amidase family protein [Kofleriaceae bacterium]|nr:amidase family protein [Kofleriaceae bacterium]